LESPKPTPLGVSIWDQLDATGYRPADFMMKSFLEHQFSSVPDGNIDFLMEVLKDFRNTRDQFYLKVKMIRKEHGITGDE
jgi:hypothetical protein